MPKYRVKPRVIEAMLFTDEPASLMKLSDFLDNGKDGWTAISYADRENPKLIIDPEQGLHANVGDYLIKFDDGRVYPMDAESFHENYEAVEPVDTQGGDAYRETMYNAWAAKQEAVK